MHPAVAEFTLQRCLNAFGGLLALNARLAAWEANEPGDLHARAYEAYWDAYRSCGPVSDEQDHESAIREAVDAVVTLAQTERRHG